MLHSPRAPVVNRDKSPIPTICGVDDDVIKQLQALVALLNKYSDLISLFTRRREKSFSKRALQETNKLIKGYFPHIRTSSDKLIFPTDEELLVALHNCQNNIVKEIEDIGKIQEAFIDKRIDTRSDYYVATQFQKQANEDFAALEKASPGKSEEAQSRKKALQTKFIKESNAAILNCANCLSNAIAKSTSSITFRNDEVAKEMQKKLSIPARPSTFFVKVITSINFLHQAIATDTPSTTQSMIKKIVGWLAPNIEKDLQARQDQEYNQQQLQSLQQELLRNTLRKKSFEGLKAVIEQHHDKANELNCQLVSGPLPPARPAETAATFTPACR